MWLLRIRRLAREIGREALVLVFAIRDPATPVALKAASVAMLAYLFSPIDLVPDVPIVGWVDDLLLISVGMPYLIRRLPPAVYLRASAKADRLLASLGIEPASKPVAPVSGTPSGFDEMSPHTLIFQVCAVFSDVCSTDSHIGGASTGTRPAYSFAWGP